MKKKEDIITAQDIAKENAMAPKTESLMIASDLNEDSFNKSTIVDSLRRYSQDGEPGVAASKSTMNSTSLSQSVSGVQEKDSRRLSDYDLRNLALIDPYISAIISARVAQVSTIMRASESRWDKGIKIRDLDPPKRSDFENDYAYQGETENRRKEMDLIMDWVLRCGTKDVETLDAAFRHSDKDFKYCTLSRWAEAQTRNALTFGRFATHYGRDDDGVLQYVRPLAVEGIQPVRPGARVFVGQQASPDNVVNNDESVEQAEEYNDEKPVDRPQSYVLKVDGTQVQIFFENDISVRPYQSQALLNLNGYPLSPIENAMFMVFIHQNTLNYLKNQFTRGLLAKSLILIRPMDPSDGVPINQEQLQVLKQQFNNLAMRTDNSAGVPVLSGSFDIQNIPLTASTRDMEWLQLEQNIIRAICASFQIDPGELGLGLLGDSASLGSSSAKDVEIITSQERGLRILVDVLIEEINEWVRDRFEHASGKYRIEATGVGSETFSGFLNRAGSEANLYSTMNMLRSESDKGLAPLPLGGDVPLNPSFNSIVLSRLTYGQFLEFYMGREGASKRAEYDFIMDPSLDQRYQQMRGVGPEIRKQEQYGQLMGAEVQQQTLAQQLAALSQGKPAEQPQEAAPVEKSEELHKSLLDAWKKLH